MQGTVKDPEIMKINADVDLGSDILGTQLLRYQKYNLIRLIEISKALFLSFDNLRKPFAMLFTSFHKIVTDILGIQ